VEAVVPGEVKRDGVPGVAAAENHHAVFFFFIAGRRVLPCDDFVLIGLFPAQQTERRR